VSTSAAAGPPTFAVVGHPNKGKSSIVSTLAQDDSVAVAAEPGTTALCRAYPMKVDGRVQYTLVDTPGFQRARRALAWMQDHETTAAEHRTVVEAFVREHRDAGGFEDECELLKPILAGAGILYVVDGSLPYGPEYEAEMEILRWTGEPSMALINPIGAGDHVEAWQAALQQYFKIVRVFNALTAPFEKQLELLRAFGQLREGWRQPLEEAVRTLELERRRVHERVARALAELLADVVSYNETKRLELGADPSLYEDSLERDYKDALREREREGRHAVEAIYGHRALERVEGGVELLDQDLFSTDHWFFWGLDRRQLVTTGAASGAVVGGVIDIGVGGSSLLLGSLIGATIGGATAWFSQGRLARTRILDQPLGGKLLRCGPTRDINFPYVVLGRALYHHARVAGRTHADRGRLTLEQESEASGWIERLPSDARKQLERVFRGLREEGRDGDAVETLRGLLVPLVAGADES
jgi:hypothetical protein